MLHMPYRYRYFSRFMGFLSSHYNKSNNSSTNTLDQEESTIYLNLKSYYRNRFINTSRDRKGCGNLY